jgi:hypothetical protein
LRAAIDVVFAHVEKDCWDQRMRRLELDQRAGHVAVYATFLRHHPRATSRKSL